MNQVTLFLCGDVMTGRGIDQILPHPTAPRLHEPYVGDARMYVDLAERAHGPIPRAAGPEDLWGDALEELDRIRPRARVINLETSVTVSDDYSREKDIHYRMHPDHVGCLAAAGVDVCVLANNHVLDFGRVGLLETLDTLAGIGLQAAGAGRTLQEAWRPARLDLPAGPRLVVYGFGSGTSGIPHSWAADVDRPGVALLDDLSERTVDRVVEHITSSRQPGDIVVASIHWGSNWGYDVPAAHVAFAHGLVDGGVDIVHGHSSHHVRPIEVYRDRLVLYGCGDFLNDYEGISGHEEFRGDLGLMYFVTVNSATGAVLDLRMTPMQVAKFRLTRAGPADVTWMCDVLNRVSAPFGSRVGPTERGALALLLPPPRDGDGSRPRA